MVQRKKNGQFMPGNSGNPTGRPATETATIRKQLATKSEAIIQVITDAALRGDIQACKLVLERVCPPLKAQAASIEVNLPHEADLSTMAENFIMSAANGSLPADIASQMVSAVSQMARVAEVSELKGRIEALERATKRKK